MIGVCIKYFHENYGGMLQAYATVSMLEKRGLNYELIRYKKHYSLWQKLKQIPRLFNVILLNDKKEALRKIIGKKKHPDFARNDSVRLVAFAKFRDAKFVSLSPVYVGFNNLCEGVKRYDAVITGSDQLWSPAGLPTNFYNLMFVPENVRKISIASSFGVKYIPWYQISRTRKYLKRIEYISMREIKGSEIVKELTGREVPTILDPVFLFDEKEWEQLVPVKMDLDEPYIFAYFLGDNVEYRNEVKEAAKELGCKIVALRHLDQYVNADESFGDYAPYNVDPECFLNLLRGAAYVCTDSFHGAAFSIIHHKQCIIFNRYAKHSKYSKNSRIDTLCENLNIKNRRFCSGMKLVSQIQEKMNYKYVDELLVKLKKETNKYLDEALDGIN